MMKQIRYFIEIICFIFFMSSFLVSCLKKDSSSMSLDNEKSNWEDISYGNLDIINLNKTKDSNNSSFGEVLNDIVSYYLPVGGACMNYTTYYSSEKPTYAHEATHGLNSCIRNYKNTTGKRANGFYLLKGKAVVVEEPRIRKSVVAQYVPNNLRNLEGTNRFNTYIVGMGSWDDTPLYIFDEWMAYINGAKEAIGLSKKKQLRSDEYGLVHGAIEFGVYASALVKAVSEKDPEYFKSNTQFKALYKYLLKTTSSLYKQGKGDLKLVSSTAETYVENFKNSELFSFIKSNYSDF